MQQGGSEALRGSSNRSGSQTASECNGAMEISRLLKIWMRQLLCVYGRKQFFKKETFGL